MAAVEAVRERPIPLPKQSPLVEFKQHPLRWIGQQILSLVWAAILGHLGAWFWIAMYYIFTQNPVIKPYWDALIPWAEFRHFIRDGGEYLLGTTFAWFALQNRWSRKNQKPYTKVEKFFRSIGFPSRADNRPTRKWQYVLVFMLTFIASIPGLLLVFGLKLSTAGIAPIFGKDIAESITNAGNSFAVPKNEMSGLTGYLLSLEVNWILKAAGILGGLIFGRVVFTKVASDAQKYLARRQALQYMRAFTPMTQWWAKPHWPLPTAYRAEFNFAVENLTKEYPENVALPVPSYRFTIWIGVATPFVVGAIIYGWFIINHVAPQ